MDFSSFEHTSQEQLDYAKAGFLWNPMCVCIISLYTRQERITQAHTFTMVWSWQATNPEQITDPQSITQVHQRLIKHSRMRAVEAKEQGEKRSQISICYVFV